jgi:Rod binding domain-containing protein
MMDIAAPPATAATTSAAVAPPRPHGKTAAETAQSFEAVFVGQITKMMMDTAEVSDTFGGGHGEEMFRGVLAEQLGTVIAKGGGIGLAPIVMQEIVRLQGGAGHVD